MLRWCLLSGVLRCEEWPAEAIFLPGAEEKASKFFGKIGKALRMKRRSEEMNTDNDDDEEEEEESSKSPYQSFDSHGKASPTKQTADISEMKSDGLLGTPIESYRWPGLCNLVHEMMTIHKTGCSLALQLCDVPWL